MSGRRTSKLNYRRFVPAALTIAGSDSGGGAGIQADLKTFAALGVHGTSAITSITAQNPAGVTHVQAVTTESLNSQIKAIFDGFQPKAAKTGMLFNRELIQSVVSALKNSGIPLVVDPVMISTSGSALLKKSAVNEMLASLLPVAALITPNLPEAEVLLDRRIESPEQMRAAARDLHHSYGPAVLIKGGHLKKSASAIDIFYDGSTELLLESDFIRAISTHGTGCTYSAAVTAYLAQGISLPDSVVKAKNFITQAIVSSWRCGGHDVLNSFWEFLP
jgi:hydroxymethylpyrimidine kinase/phosphomethylpyrimidine kinase